MKIITNLKKDKTLSLLLLCFLTASCTGLVSCSKNKGDVSLTAYVMAANSAQASAPQDFYVDNIKENNAPIAYSQSTGYINITGSSHIAQFKTSSNANVNISFSLPASPGGYYTVFYTGGTTATTYQDDHTTPQSGNARVRFINLSPAITGNVDISTVAGVNVISKLAYRVASVYTDISAASAFTLSASATGTVLLNIPASLEAGHIYTIFISGATSATVIYTLIDES